MSALTFLVFNKQDAYLYEIRQAYFDAYPESQRDLVMRIRSAVKSFKFDRSLIQLSMYHACIIPSPIQAFSVTST